MQVMLITTYRKTAVLKVETNIINSIAANLKVETDIITSITASMKVETDIITSIAASPILCRDVQN